MQKLYIDTRKLDSSCRAAYGLTEEIMMENAAMALEKIVRNPTPLSGDRRAPQKVLIACGAGNNGADGYTLARRLRFDYDVTVVQFFQPESDLCKVQADRAEKCGVRFVERDDLSFYDLRTDIIIDCIFGSGFHGELDDKVYMALNDMNTCDCLKISCDVPSGLREDGTVAEGAFVADVTVTMGALKTSLYSDCAKDYVGEICCGELGVNRRLYENSSNSSLSVGMLLEESDLVLPHRDRCNVNKGSFGHVVVASGEKQGAAVLAGSAALRFGAGLVTVVHKGNGKKSFETPAELMAATEIPENIKAIAFGMGLGKENSKVQPYFDWVLAHSDSKCVVDADALCSEGLKEFIEKKEKGVVLTPHPKEFQEMLKNCDLGEYTVPEIVEKRLELVEKFCRKFPKKTLLLKGANPVIGYFDGYKYKMFINPFGRPCLAKAGSGDVLSGLIVALLAQKRKSIEAAIGGSLAHALASRKIKCDYAMTPMDLINAVAEL